MTTVFVDVETRSRVDLRKFSVYRYAACPDFRILMAAWSVDGGPVLMDTDQGDALARLKHHRDAGARFVAHNANFERVVFSYALGLAPTEWLPPAEWDDTQAIAAEYGWPQSLGKLAAALGAEAKDEAGTRLINLFSKPRLRDGGWNDATTHPSEWLEFVMYCSQDVSTLIDVAARLGDWPTPMERRIYLADQAVNDRGIAVDLVLARPAQKAGELNAVEQKERVRELTGVRNPNSPQQMGRWAAQVGLDMPDWKAATVTAALATELAPEHREVLTLRQELALAAPAKFSAALEGEVGGRLRGTLRFFGAHTGRWGGRGVQPQNLPRAAFEYEVDQHLAIEDLLAGERISSEELKKLVRPMFVGPFTVVDYSSIEARVIAWLAGEQWALDAFRDGRDIYVETAAKMGGLTRAQGKIAVLALGFNGGPGALRKMAQPGDQLRAGLRLLDASDEVLREELVWPWRAANPAICRLWKTLDARFRSGGPVGAHLAIEKHGKHRLLRLPSGRAIAYRDCKVVHDEEGRERITFADPQGGRRADTYGGKLAENATQAVARDLLAEALVRLVDRGYPVAAHVHDELIVDGAYDVEEISAVVTELPSWATGLPIDGSGYTSYRYRKG